MQRPLTGICPACAAPILIPRDYPRLMVACPTCEREVPVRVALANRRKSDWMRWAGWTSLVLVVALALGVLGYVYRGHLLSGLNIVADATGSRTLAVLSVAAGLLLLACVVLWLLLPLILYFGLKDLRRRTAQLDETSRLCLRHLARLTGPREAAVPAPAVQKPAPSARDSDPRI